MGQEPSPAHLLANILNTQYQEQALIVEGGEIGFDKGIHQSFLHNTNYNKLQNKR